MGVPDKERSVAARTHVCEKGLWKDSLPVAYTPFIGERRGRKCLVSGLRGEVRLQESIGLKRLKKRMSRTIK